MHGDILPLFPLEVVLFPRTILPLHIFEERYREMIGTALREESEFGVVLARENGIVNLGCTAVVSEVVERYEDGRLDIMTTGRRRFEVLSLNEERAYLRGDVRFYEDTDLAVPTADQRQQAIDAYQAVRRFLPPMPGKLPDLQDPQLSFQLAQVLNDLDFRQQLLANRSEVTRLQQLTEYFPNYIARERHVAHIKTVAPTNGHAHSTVIE
jgi:Lon protease-like protein